MGTFGGSPPREIQRVGYLRELELTELFVTLLPEDCSTQELCNYFGHYGVVTNVTILRNYNTEQQGSYGFVKFLNPGDAASALNNLDRPLFRRQEIVVQYARSRHKKRNSCEMMAKKLASSVTPLPSPIRIPSPEPRGNAHSRSPSLSGSDLGVSEDESLRQQPLPAEGGRASPAGRDNHTRDHPGGVVVSPADESSAVRVELGDAWRGRACGGCGDVVHVWNDHHGCTGELSQDVIPRLCMTLFRK